MTRDYPFHDKDWLTGDIYVDDAYVNETVNATAATFVNGAWTANESDADFHGCLASVTIHSNDDSRAINILCEMSCDAAGTYSDQVILGKFDTVTSSASWPITNSSTPGTYTVAFYTGAQYGTDTRPFPYYRWRVQIPVASASATVLLQTFGK